MITLLKRPLSRRSLFLIALGGLTAAGASAGTVHRMALTTTNGGGSNGSLLVLNTTSTGGAVQGQVGSSALTTLNYPFGLFGVYNSSNFGIGVVGTSTTGYGVAGESTNTNASIFGLTGGTGPALQGVTASSPTNSSPTIFGTNNSTGDGGEFVSVNSDGVDGHADSTGWGGYFESSQGIGVEGDSDGDSSGVYGYSASGDGVNGETSDGNSGVAGVQYGTGYGIYGSSAYNAATPAPTAPAYTNPGVYGQSKVGPGVYGVSLETAQADYDSQRSAGVFGFGNGGPGIEGHSNAGIGVYGQTASTNFPAIFGETLNATGTALSFYVFNDQTAAITYANANGDFYTDGTITSGSDTYQARTRNPNTDITTYSAQHTEATVEDFGSAQLVSGAAVVPLAADFRQTINASQPYMVFLTPYGDTNGLYVASRTPAGFVVRETHGGRSSLSFDYRIVARPYGSLHARLPHLRDRAPLPDRSRILAARRATLPFNGAAPAERFLSASNQKRLAQPHAKFARFKAPPVPSNLFRLSAAGTP